MEKSVEELFQDTAWKKELSLLIEKAVNKNLPQVVKDAVKAELSNHCMFEGIPAKSAKQIGAYINVLSAKTDGNIIEFFDRAIQNHEWLEDQRKRGATLSLAFYVFVIGSVTAGAFTFIGLAFKNSIKDFFS
jgi:hypothetical protein